MYSWGGGFGIVSSSFLSFRSLVYRRIRVKNSSRVFGLLRKQPIMQLVVVALPGF